MKNLFNVNTVIYVYRIISFLVLTNIHDIVSVTDRHIRTTLDIIKLITLRLFILDKRGSKIFTLNIFYQLFRVYLRD